MIRILLSLLLLTIITAGATAQQERYVSDEIFIVLHAGPGSNYRWLAKLIPGTILSEQRLSTDGNWAEVATDRGTVGWVRAEYLSTEAPAQVRLPDAVRQLEEAQGEAETLRASMSQLQSEFATLQDRHAESAAELQRVSEELTQLRQISGSAVETADNNRQLVEESASMRMTIDTLKADNLRLHDRISNNAFFDGALAVLLGVIITLVIPRLWPRRKSSSSWA